MSPTSSRRAMTGVTALAAAGLLATGAAAAPSPAPAGAALPVAEPAPPEVTADRIAGDDRDETAAEISAEYPEGTDVVYIASRSSFPDALTARAPGDELPPLQPDGAWPMPEEHGVQAPILLTGKTRLPQATKDALDDLDPSTIRVVGGESTIDPDIDEQLKEWGEVERYGGKDRYETSALVAGLFDRGQPIAYIATGETFPDALTGGAVAARSQAPILLTKSDELPSATAKRLEALQPEQVVVFGGTNSVDGDVLDAITAIVPDTERVAGADRYGTSQAIAERYEKDPARAFVADGGNYPDALTGSSLAGYEGVPLVLTKTGALPEESRAALEYLSPQGATIFGGTASVSAAVQGELTAALPVWADQAHLQLLSFNDYHGHLEEVRDEETGEVVEGVEHLSATMNDLRTLSYDDQSLTVAAGDLIGGSTFLSGIFHDEPSVDSMEQLGLDLTSVGNHEFDEGTDELLRMQNGGCHPVDGCVDGEPYDGADFPWLAANVVEKDSGETLLPGTKIKEVEGVLVGFIGMTLEATPTLVSPGGVADVEFKDEVETANAQAAQLQEQGVEAIVVLLHEGGYDETDDPNDCDGLTGPIVDINAGLDASIDTVITGHTHQEYICAETDPAGQQRMVTSAGQYGRAVTSSDVVLSRSGQDVVRESTSAVNVDAATEASDPVMADLVAKWAARSDEAGGEVVGTVAEDITGDSSGDRGIETPMGDLVADSILAGTDGADEGGAQLSLMNIGGVRASLLVDDITNDEQPGEVTYAEAYEVAPFGNLLVSMDLTGAQLKAVLEQQYDPDRSRDYLALGVSEGFTYTFDKDADRGEKVSEMQLDGQPLEMDATYRVSTLNFLAEGGDSFTAFTEGTNLTGGPEDLANLVDYLGANPGLTAPEDRVDGL